MFVAEIVAIVATTAYAVYRQTVVTEVATTNRFKLAVIYGIVGLVAGGFAPPHGVVGCLMLAAGLVLSAVVGVIGGYRTDIWMEPDGRIVRQGNLATVLPFLGLVAVRLGMGVVAYLAGISDGVGFGEIVVMIAIMVAFQAEIVHRRGRRLALAVRRVPAAG